MFERLLERISVSPYKDNFILKGGILIAAMVGLDTRSTMDMDVTIKAYPLDQERIRGLLERVCAIRLNDDVSFRVLSLEFTRKDDEYGGFHAGLEARYDTLITPLSLDISTGDIITPREILYPFKAIFDDGKQIELWAYNIETILAEKVETILRRGVFNTRLRDFYDVYILSETQQFDMKLFTQALALTAINRGTSEQIADVSTILEMIENSADLQVMWTRYQQEYEYAYGITYGDTVAAVSGLVNIK